MSDSHSDALVFFGATGDQAYKKIFPALQAILKRGHVDVPVIGVAKAGWNLEQFRARAHNSLEKHGGVNAAAFNKLSGLMRYVAGDYTDPSTFNRWSTSRRCVPSQDWSRYGPVTPTKLSRPTAISCNSATSRPCWRCRVSLCRPSTGTSTRQRLGSRRAHTYSPTRQVEIRRSSSSRLVVKSVSP